jgi:aryl-alcohol dehydrogenase-like predicted oxidoreductase
MVVMLKKVCRLLLDDSLSAVAHLFQTEKTFACMKAAYDAGVNFFDCAEAYAGMPSIIVVSALAARY